MQKSSLEAPTVPPTQSANGGLEPDHDQQLDDPVHDRLQRRSAVELLRSRLDLLGDRDKALMTVYLDSGTRVYQIAKLLGVSPSTVTRRIRTLSQRLLAGDYERRIESAAAQHRLTPAERQIANEYFFTGLSLRDIAAKRNWSYYRTRETWRRIRMVLENDR
jgi:DNA-directed RNA polymerase specialized sigma subunit